MRALCVKQPWASMIARGEKTIEVRSWHASYRGDLAIVASRSPKIPGMPVGEVVAIVRLAMICLAAYPASGLWDPLAGCDVYAGDWLWHLEDVRPVAAGTWPTRGRVSLFTITRP